MDSKVIDTLVWSTLIPHYWLLTSNFMSYMFVYCRQKSVFAKQIVYCRERSVFAK